MPILRKNFAFAAGARDRNVFATEIFRQLSYDAALSLALTASAADDLVVRKFFIGERLVAEDFEVDSTNNPPILPDDLFVEDVIAMGEEMLLDVENEDAVNTATLRLYALIDPM